MMIKVRKTLQENRGSVYVEFLVGFFGIMLCVGFAMAVLPIFSVRATLDNTADKLLRMAELRGDTSNVALEQSLQDETGIAFIVDWNGTEYIDGTQQVQLMDDIKLEISSTQTLSFFNFGSYPITLKTTLHGTSEVYHK